LQNAKSNSIANATTFEKIKNIPRIKKSQTIQNQMNLRSFESKAHKRKLRGIVRE